MSFELILAVLGSLIFLGVVVAGFTSARRTERELQDSRIPIVTYTVYLEYFGFAISIYLAVTGVVMLLDQASGKPDWQLPVLFLVLASMQGFPKGILIRPGLTNSGLILLGTLYKWDDFSAFQKFPADRIRLLYRKPWLGIRSIKVRIHKSSIEDVVAMLEKSGVPVQME